MYINRKREPNKTKVEKFTWTKLLKYTNIDAETRRAPPIPNIFLLKGIIEVNKKVSTRRVSDHIINATIVANAAPFIP